jgi:hypothetical protein
MFYFHFRIFFLAPPSTSYYFAENYNFYLLLSSETLADIYQTTRRRIPGNNNRQKSSPRVPHILIKSHFSNVWCKCAKIFFHKFSDMLSFFFSSQRNRPGFSWGDELFRNYDIVILSSNIIYISVAAGLSHRCSGLKSWRLGYYVPPKRRYPVSDQNTIPSNLAEEVNPLTPNQKVRISTGTEILAELFRGFLQSLQENSGMQPQTRPRPLLSTIFLMHYSLASLLVTAVEIWTDLMRTSLNKP